MMEPREWELVRRINSSLLDAVRSSWRRNETQTAMFIALATADFAELKQIQEPRP